jgi:parallel beta-helix repeat protein
MVNISGFTIQNYGGLAGILISGHYHNIQDNVISDNWCDYGGIFNFWSNYDNIIDNIFVDNSRGITLYQGTGVNVTGNTFSNTGYGIWLPANSNNNFITGNTFLNNKYYGIYFHTQGPSNNNNIYHNNFINNTYNARDIYTNTWDDGYPSGGNYWDDYTGVDNFHGPNQDIPGSDGIGDTPYNIPGGSNKDRYPLMTPYGPPHADFTYTRNDKTVTFNASVSYDYDGMIISYKWDFGDNTNGTGMTVEHTYSDYGIFNVTLTVKDDDNKTDIFVKSVCVDNVLPEIIDSTPGIGYTGDAFTFNATVTDDFQVSTVWVEYWYGTGSHTNVSMNNVAGDYWEKTIIINDTLDMLHYFISACDLGYNWNTTDVSDVTIYDNDDPVISNVQAIPSVQVMGEYVNVSTSVVDNIEVGEVFLIIEYPDSSIENFSITQNRTGDTYFCNKTYGQPGVHAYHIWANDTSGNSNISAEYTFTIQDITLPEIVDNTPSIGFTGDAFAFNATVTDNFLVSTVWVEYWYGTGSHTNVSMNNVADDYWEKAVVIDDTLEVLHYFISAIDTSDNWNNTGVSDVTIYDNDEPQIVDNTPLVASAGHLFTFNSTITDNINVSAAWVEYWYAAGGHTNVSMNNLAGDFWEKAVVIDDTLEVLHYFISAIDTSDNWNNTGVSDVTIYDVDDPEISNVQAVPPIQMMGGYVNVSSSVVDNIEVGEVFLHIEYPDSSIGNFSISQNKTGGTYFCNKTYGQPGTYTYYIWANDTSGNTNSSTVYMFTIQDITIPEIFDNTPGIGYTGDAFAFNATVTDNFQVSTVWAVYWYGTGGHTNVSMNNVADDYWEKTIVIDDTLEILHYFISASDLGNNWNTTDISDVIIYDNDEPQIVDNTPSVASAGHLFTFNSTITDNINVSATWVEYWYAAGGHTNVSMNNLAGDFWEKTIVIDDTLEVLHYFISANDTSDNWNITGVNVVTIYDNDDPLISNVQAVPSVQMIGGYVNISAVVNDNIEVDEIYLYIEYPDNVFIRRSGSKSLVAKRSTIENFSITQNQTDYTYYCNKTYQHPGTYTYHIWANDTSGNSNISADYTFTMQDTTPPEIGDNTPSIGYTGDAFAFNATVTDDFQVSTVWAEYWYGIGGHTNVSMNMVAGDFWERTVIIDDTLEVLHYFISANDISDNWNNTGVNDVIIYDNDDPEISNVQAVPSVQLIGGYVNISSTVVDNIEVEEVYLYIVYPDSSIENLSITQNRTGDTYYCNKSYSQVGIYIYYIWANDASGNANVSSDYNFEIVQNNPPDTPSDPLPLDGATGVNVDAVLSWKCSDPDGDLLTYDVYYDTNTTPKQVAWNQSMTSYNPSVDMSYNTTYYWMIVAWDSHGASTLGPIWHFTTEYSIPDLDCDGELTWTGVKPGTTVIGSFNVSNIGDPGSLLDWEIVEWPDRGTWTFDPLNGDNLKPEDGVIMINVSVIVPKPVSTLIMDTQGQNKKIIGEVKIINLENSSDYCTIPISLITPVNQPSSSSKVLQVFQKFRQRSPLFR